VIGIEDLARAELYRCWQHCVVSTDSVVFSAGCLKLIHGTDQ
jgi:hypothetical protein